MQGKLSALHPVVFANYVHVYCSDYREPAPVAIVAPLRAFESHEVPLYTHSPRYFVPSL